MPQPSTHPIAPSPQPSPSAMRQPRWRSHSGTTPILWAIIVAAIIFMIAAHTPLRAQHTPPLQHHWKHPTHTNPAASGQSPRLMLSALVRTHTSGYDLAGSTMWADADIALQTAALRHGVGASFLNDAIGLLAHKRFSLRYAHHRQLRAGNLSLGIQADLMQQEIDGSKADLADAGDPAIPSGKINGSAIDLSAGIIYTHRALTLGISAQQLTAPTIELGETHQLPLRTVLNLHGHYRLPLSSPHYSLVPALLLRSDLRDHRVDLHLRGVYHYQQQHLYAALNYAPTRSISLMVGGNFKGIDLGYGYEINTAGIGGGQHEISLIYHLELDLGKKGRNLHKSVRWL